MMGCQIRLGVIDDLNVLEAIRAAAFAPVFASLRALVGPSIAPVAFRDTEQEQQALLRDLLEPGGGRMTLVAERDGVVHVFCAASWKTDTKVGEIGLNAVLRAGQNRRPSVETQWKDRARDWSGSRYRCSDRRNVRQGRRARMVD